MTEIVPCTDFIKRLQELLTIPVHETHKSTYLNLNEVEGLQYEDLVRDHDLPPNDPTELAFELILTEVQKEHLDKVISGLNEFLKSYLRNLNRDNQAQLTNQYCKRVVYLFRRSLNTFCYSEEVWDFLSHSFKPICIYLLQQGLYVACEMFWGFASQMGKLAAKHNLHMDSLQRSLRIFEVFAEENGCQDLASHARNLRHNLEN